MPRFKTPIKKEPINLKCSVTGKQIGCQEVAATFHCGVRTDKGYEVIKLELSQEVADQIIEFLKKKYSKCALLAML